MNFTILECHKVVCLACGGYIILAKKCVVNLLVQFVATNGEVGATLHCAIPGRHLLDTLSKNDVHDQKRIRPVRAAASLLLFAYVRMHYGASPVRCRGVNMFSPEGRLFQVEYAIEAIKLGGTALGICTREGVVLAVEKRVTSTLMEPDSILKIMEVDNHICA